MNLAIVETVLEGPEVLEGTVEEEMEELLKEEKVACEEEKGTFEGERGVVENDFALTKGRNGSL